jgi:hypothetical protein
VVFYIGTPKSVFAANITLASPGLKLSEEEKEKLSHGISFYRSDAGVRLKDIVVWEHHQPVVNLLSDLGLSRVKKNGMCIFKVGNMNVGQ